MAGARQALHKCPYNVLTTAPKNGMQQQRIRAQTKAASFSCARSTAATATKWGNAYDVARMPARHGRFFNGRDCTVMGLLWALGGAPIGRVVNAIDVGATISCSLSNHEYLDISSLECIRCDDASDGTGNNGNKVPDESNLDPYGNALTCTCAEGFRVSSVSCSDGALQSGACAGFICNSCGDSSESAFSDGSACVSCGNSTDGLGDQATECSCPVDGDGVTKVLLEYDQGGDYLSEKACESCVNGAYVFETVASVAGVYYEADPFTCRTCPDEHMSFDSTGACTCGFGYTKTGAASLGAQRCVASAYVTDVSSWRTSSAYSIVYRSVVSGVTSSASSTTTISSLTFEHLFTWAGAHCYSYTGTGSDGLQACQSLGNLCVLQLHRPSSSACDLFNTILGNRLSTSHGQLGWGVTLPWLEYVDEALDVRDGTDIETQFTFSSQIRIVLAKYSLDGTWMGLEDLTTQPYYCRVGAPETSAGGGESRSTKYVVFGHSMTEAFECDLSLLLGQEAYFYDPYILDEATGDLMPVAVLNTNYVSNGLQPNLNLGSEDELDDIFTRRFFFFDVVSGVTDASGTTASSSSSSVGAAGGSIFVPEVLRYMTDMRLTFKIRDKEPESIYPPILEVTYAEVKPAQWDTYPSLQRPMVTFTVEYTMDTQDFWDLCRAFFAVVIVLTSLTAMWRLRNWNVRTNRYEQPGTAMAPQYMYQMINWPLVLQGLLLMSHTFVLYLFPFTFMITAYWFIFFKMQESVFIMLPANRRAYGSNGEYYPLEMMVAIMFLSQSFRVGHVVYRQCTSDIFLIDWEKNRRSNVRGVSNDTNSAGGGSAQDGGVSVWRQLLVANEWNRLGTRRRVSPVFSLICMAFLLGGTGLQYNATPQPALGDTEEGELNPALRFANVTFWWTLLCGLQLLVVWGVSERFFVEPPELRFVDLATMAKVSVLILDEKFHGWYLHCRSPYPRADVALETMSEQLDKEEAGLTTDRGLEGCAPGMQAFELFISSTFRKKYDKVYRSLLPPSGFDLQARMAAGNSNDPQTAGLLGDQARALGPRGRTVGGAAMGAFRGLRGLTGAAGLPKKSEKTVAAAKELSAFLQGFVEQNYTREELTRSYREPAWWDRLVGTPPDMRQMVTSPCILYPDIKSWFTGATFLGIELDLLLFNITAYHLFDQSFGDPTTSALITFLLDRLMLGIRAYCGRSNVSRKTLVDGRFLL